MSKAAKRTRLPAPARRSEIVGCALRLADKVGPDRLTTDMIAREIGITQPAIFRHFARKEEIWNAVGVRLGEKFAAAWQAASADERPPADAIKALALAQIGAIRSTPGLIGVLFSRQLHVDNKALRSAINSSQRAFHALLSDAFRTGVASGEFRPDLEPSDAAFLVISVVQSLALRWSLAGKSFDLASEAARLLDAQIVGFRSQGR